MPPSKRPAVTPREVSLQAGCERVETSGLFRSNFPHLYSCSTRADFVPKDARGEKETARASQSSGCKV